ncbi:G-alpha protein [Radiomyces spectabilis]|uniref:G-alpha protein n=1 Tax=Radiomyces spectabilis TaxID=64574 RepID=UPI00221E8BCF|nr:G-alpha protein [Radiomyces spectabilis]KAI8372756.1 G-alpha protein [Radiomyces spectabilis]
MGCCQSRQKIEEKQRNHEINSQIKRDRASMRSEIKMLLLGAGESGKSTILKQMKLIHDGGYTPEEREIFKEVIYSNTIQSMRVILEAMTMFGMNFQEPQNAVAADLIIDTPIQLYSMTSDVVAAIEALWQDGAIRACVARANEFQLNDSAQYYFDSISRIGDPNYMPSDQDVRMFDVGGQRSERKKWIHCFENVTAVVFLVAISEYDQCLAEDITVNRLQESLTLFDSICNSRWFTKTSIILFLNKIDLFAQKLARNPLSRYFADYLGADSYDHACQYLLQRFVSLNNRADTKQIYTHFTCATDTKQIRFVMAAVSDIIVTSNLRKEGLL